MQAANAEGKGLDQHAFTPAAKKVKISSEALPDTKHELDVTGDTEQTHETVDSLPSTMAVTPATSLSSLSSGSSENQQTARTPLTCKKTIQSLLWDEAGYKSECCGSDTVKKRSDYISWDDYFMATAALSSHRSKDPVNATGACIVDSSNRIIGTGYNGFPAGCSDDVLPWKNDTTTKGWLHSKAPYVVHAEVNAILNKCAPDCAGARLYTQRFPCNECSKVIVQSGISEVIYLQDKSTEDSDSVRASRILLSMAGVRMRSYEPVSERLQLDFSKVLDSKELENANEQFADAGREQQDELKVAAVKYRELLIKEANYDPVSEGSAKRKDALSWDDYFMAMAFLTAQRSKDPNTQVGACIVDANKRIVGLGYNGFPVGCSDDDLPWARKAESDLHKKYLYVVHAEVNAILNKGSADVKNSTLYVALFPCNECAKLIIQAGILEVVYMSDHYHDSDGCKASRILFQMAGVKLRKHVPNVPSICIQLNNNH